MSVSYTKLFWRGIIGTVLRKSDTRQTPLAEVGCAKEREREIEKEGIKSGENREQWKRKSEMPQLVRIVPNIQLMLSEPSTYTPFEHSRNDILLRHPKHYPF